MHQKVQLLGFDNPPLLEVTILPFGLLNCLSKIGKVTELLIFVLILHRLGVFSVVSSPWFHKRVVMRKIKKTS